MKEIDIAAIWPDTAESFVTLVNGSRSSRNIRSLAWDQTLADKAARNREHHGIVLYCTRDGYWQVWAPGNSFLDALQLWRKSPIHLFYLTNEYRTKIGIALCPSGVTCNLL
jgi:hypothetical protein